MGIKDINGIKLQGAMFQQKTTLDFGLDQKRICLIYGRNGSGKSTISRAVEKISGKTEIDSLSACFVDKNSSPVVLNDDGLKNIHVFNEDFIKDRIWVKPTPEAIVMLRDEKESNCDKTRTIADVDNDIKACETERKKYNEDLEEYNNVKSDKSLLFYRKRIANTLKRPGGWAYKYRQIYNGKRAVPVTNAMIDKIIEHIPIYKHDDIQTKYDELFAKIQSARISKSKINADVPLLDITFNEAEVLSLLAEKIESPQLSAREQTLLNYISDLNFGSLSERKTRLENAAAYCPYCLQDIPSEHREHLLKTISQILNDKADAHRNELDEKHLPDLSAFDVTVFEVLNRDVFVAYRSVFNELRTVIEHINNMLDTKIKNLYEPLNVEGFNWNDCYTKYTEATDKLKEEIQSYNQIIDDSSAIEKCLCDIVDEMAWRETESDRIELAKREIEKQQTHDRIKLLDNKIDRLEAEKLELEQQLRSTDIAMEKINEYLGIVFADSETIRLEPYDIKTYRLISNGNPIDSQSLSTGERNIIALCYFFVAAMAGKNEAEAFQKPQLFIIDDPICSFDADKRIGVMSLLRTMTGIILSANADNKILVMSHDFFVLDEYNSTLKGLSNDNVTKFFYELHNGCLTQINKNNFDEYTDLMQVMYEYAVGEKPEYGRFAGNSMRRLIEAFGTFAYKSGIWKLHDNDRIWNEIKDAELRKALINYMFKPPLNEGSHSEDRIKRLNDFIYVEMIQPNERLRTVRVVFVLLYSLFPLHIEMHLNKNKGWKENIESWRDHEVLHKQ